MAYRGKLYSEIEAENCPEVSLTKSRGLTDHDIVHFSPLEIVT